jgi:hypothetical protein
LYSIWKIKKKLNKESSLGCRRIYKLTSFVISLYIAKYYIFNEGHFHSLPELFQAVTCNITSEGRPWVREKQNKTHRLKIFFFF